MNGIFTCVIRLWDSIKPFQALKYRLFEEKQEEGESGIGRVGVVPLSCEQTGSVGAA